MEYLLQASSPNYLSLKAPTLRVDSRTCPLNLPHGSFPSSSTNIIRTRKSLSVRVEAKGKRKSNKEDTHSFIPKPDEATGPFPEAVLLKEKKLQEDGRLVPDFADDEEKKLYEFLDLELQSELKVERMRHYEVVYLIHEKHNEEVENVNEKIQDFLRQKKGKVWRFNDWGLRRLAYKIQKANYAHYILMNFELEAKYINEFKMMLDKDERVIRHLVIKRDEAITEDCPPPPEFHTLRSGSDEYDEDNEEDAQFEEEEYEEEEDDSVVAVYEDEDGENSEPSWVRHTGKEGKRAVQSRSGR